MFRSGPKVLNLHTTTEPAILPRNFAQKGITGMNVPLQGTTGHQLRHGISGSGSFLGDCMFRRQSVPPTSTHVCSSREESNCIEKATEFTWFQTSLLCFWFPMTIVVTETRTLILEHLPLSANVKKKVSYDCFGCKLKTAGDTGEFLRFRSTQPGIVPFDGAFFWLT